MQIKLFSFLNAFGEGSHSLHPGFSVDGTICVLTHTKPWQRKYISVPSAFVNSSHFKARSDRVYLALASTSAYRYNNAPGGTLAIQSELLLKISNFLKKPITELILKTTTVMSKETLAFMPFAIAAAFLPQTQVELFPTEPDDEMLIPSAETGEILSIQEMYEKMADKSEEELSKLLDLYPTQVKAFMAANLAASIQPLFPGITLEVALPVLGKIDEINELAQKATSGTEDEVIEATIALEELVGLKATLPTATATETNEPVVDTPEPSVEDTTEPTTEEPTTEPTVETLPAAIPAVTSQVPALNPKHVQAAKEVIKGLAAIQAQMTTMMQNVVTLLETEEA